MSSLKSTVLAVFLLAAGTAAALAHAKMTSVPKDGATVPAGLSQIELDFSKPVRLTVVHVTRAKEKQEVATKSELPKSFAKSAMVAVDALPSGDYEVAWTAVADDGHVMNGTFKFSVGEVSDAKPGQ